jgi:RNA polymerase sigma factor (sigma-70 family)
MIARHEGALKRTARRYSLDREDADDAYQRALEIVLTKAPTTDPRELIRWTQTVTKHEALAVRQHRERLLGHPIGGELDPVALIPASTAGPDERAERREEVARSREALLALKPAELRALTLLAEGYSYAEIGEITGFSRTKINRVLAEGRDRFRALVSSSEDGSRCRQLRPLLSALCDGEANPQEAVVVREHLRACARCRATMRTYRAAPRIAAALAPILPPSRSLLGRTQEMLGGLAARLPGVGGDPATQVAIAGGSRGAGMAALAKLLAVCAGAVGGAGACVATGVVPSPIDAGPNQAQAPPAKRYVDRSAEASPEGAVQYEPAPPPEPEPVSPHRQPKQPAPAEAVEPEAAPATGAVEYEPPATPAAAPVESSSPEPTSSGNAAAGEFGP